MMSFRNLIILKLLIKEYYYEPSLKSLRIKFQSTIPFIIKKAGKTKKPLDKQVREIQYYLWKKIFKFPFIADQIRDLHHELVYKIVRDKVNEEIDLMALVQYTIDAEIEVTIKHVEDLICKYMDGAE